jgi:hypothetical protein
MKDEKLFPLPLACYQFHGIILPRNNALLCFEKALISPLSAVALSDFSVASKQQ